jgi:enamine deaminase RidA (YjgF/YER057c/UK114 family)
VEKRVVNPWTWQEQFGFSHAQEVRGAHDVLYLAGQASVDSDGSPIHEGDMRAQLSQAFDNVETVLKEAGFSLSDVVRLNYYATDIDAFFEAQDVITTRMTAAGNSPAGTLLGVQRLAFPALLIELEATAVK